MTGAAGFDRDPFAPANGPAKGFTLTRLRHIDFDTSPPYIVDELIPREGLVLVWGAPKCGKTFWTFDLVAHVALGRTYCEREVEQGPVVYIACEGERGVKTRAVAFRQTRLREADDPPFFLMTTRLDLVVDIDVLVEAVRGQLDGIDRCAVIVIDTLNRSIHGSESRDDDMGAYVQAADRLREEFHCCVLLIHHCGISGDRPRGHTSLTGAIDTQISVQKDADGTILVTLELSKDGPSGTMMRSRLDVVEVGIDDRGKAITSCVIEQLGEGGGRGKPLARLAAPQRVALAMLHEAINTGGSLPPSSNHIPAGARAVTEELWRQYAYQGGIAAGDATQDAKRKAFKRAAQSLVADGRVGTWDGWFWPVEPSLDL